MFIDELEIKVIAGNGGNGCMSFRREKFIPKGGPDGGDGGNGGDIVLAVDPNKNTLNHLNSQKVYKAPKGEHGKGKNMHGRNGENLIIQVPPGTVVFNQDKSTQLADLSSSGEQTIIAKGGKGGLGNARFTTSTHQAPRFAETGEPGEEKNLVLELKMVADIGLIGLPSAGKSTLISTISNARPKIAAYHFTTLSPNLGVVNMNKFGGSKNDTFVVADIPGLIEGASKGKGLGHQFLKHITRTKLLVHVIDCSLENPENDYKTIIKELKSFDKKLAEREEIIVINKIDLLNEEQIEEINKKIKKISKKAIFNISALTKEGLKPLMLELSKKLQKIRKLEQVKASKEPKREIPILRPHLKKVKFEIDKIRVKKDYKIFYLSGERIEQLFIMTDINNLEGLERIYTHFEKSGINKALKKNKAQLGDQIRVGDKKIAYRP